MAIIIVRKRKVEIIEKPKKVDPVSGPLLDSTVKYLIEEHPNLLVAYYLMASWLYYCRDVAMISDSLFDEICETLYAHWDDVEHMHKHLIDREALKAGTGYYIPKDKYPGMTRAAAAAFVNASWNTHISADL